MLFKCTSLKLGARVPTEAARAQFLGHLGRHLLPPGSVFAGDSSRELDLGVGRRHDLPGTHPTLHTFVLFPNSYLVERKIAAQWSFVHRNANECPREVALGGRGPVDLRIC